jgi:hypothetical protein
MNMDLAVEPLTERIVPGAAHLGARVFPNHADDIAAAYLRALDPKKAYLTERRLLQYFVAIDSETKKMLAITGLYK